MGSFEHPKHMFKLMCKKVIKILRTKNFQVGAYGHIVPFVSLICNNLTCADPDEGTGGPECKMFGNV